METLEPSRKTRAIMFSDIQGYSKLMGENESLALRLLEEHNSICVPLIQRHRGVIVKFIGDAILSSFESAADAVECGLTLQRLLAERNGSRPDVVPLVLRIGIHIGDVVFKDGDVFGDGVNIAARIEPLAEPGGIAISQTVYDMIKARPEIQTVSLGTKDLKNIKEAVNIYKVIVDASAPAASADWARAAKMFAGGAVAAGLICGGVMFARRGDGASSTRAPAETPSASSVRMPAAPVPSGADKASELQRMHDRDDAYWQMWPQLQNAGVADAEKNRIALAYYDRFHLDPGINPGNAADFAPYLPPGPARQDVAALAASPVGVEARARLKIKSAASRRITETLKIPPGPERKKFLLDCPVIAKGWLVELKEGEPARDSKGRLTFRYWAAPGQSRDLLVSGDVLKPGPAGDAASERAGADVADAYLKSR